MIIWRIRGKITRTVLCCIACHNLNVYRTRTWMTLKFCVFINYEVSLFALRFCCSVFVYFRMVVDSLWVLLSVPAQSVAVCRDGCWTLLGGLLQLTQRPTKIFTLQTYTCSTVNVLYLVEWNVPTCDLFQSVENHNVIDFYRATQLC